MEHELKYEISLLKADFPRYKYPLAENTRENEAEDERCLAQVEELIEAAVGVSYIAESSPLTRPLIAGCSRAPRGRHHL